MRTNFINLVSLKPTSLGSATSFFDDTIDAVAKIIESSGFTVVKTINTLAVDAINIVWGVGTHLYPDVRTFRKVANPTSTIIFNMEQIGSDSPLVSADYIRLLSDYVVFDYNDSNVKALEERVGRRVRAYEFPVLPSIRLFPIQAVESSIDCDCIFFGAISDRRRRLLDGLIAAGLNVRVVRGFGEDLSREMRRAKFVLNIHLHPTAIFEVARVLRPLSIGVPIVSETSAMPLNVSWRDAGVVFTDLGHLVQTCVRLANDNSALIQQTRNAIAFATTSGERVPRGLVADLLKKLGE